MGPPAARSPGGSWLTGSVLTGPLASIGSVLTGRVWAHLQCFHQVGLGPPAALSLGALTLIGSAQTGPAGAHRQRVHRVRFGSPAALLLGPLAPTGSAQTGPAGAHRQRVRRVRFGSPAALLLGPLAPTGSALTGCVRAHRWRFHWACLHPPAAYSPGALVPTGNASLAGRAWAHRCSPAHHSPVPPPGPPGTPQGTPPGPRSLLPRLPRAHHHPSRHPSKNLRTLRRTPGTDTSGATLPTNPLRASADISPAACNCGTIAA